MTPPLRSELERSFGRTVESPEARTFRILYHEKDGHDRFAEGMPPPPVLVLEDLSWPEPLSEDPEEDRRLTQKQVAAANAAYYRQVLAECRQAHPTWWTRLLNWWRRVRRGYKDERGRVFDFHSLRGQLVTTLVRAGVHLVKVQKFARHSTPNLTANAYTHLELADLRGDVEKLPPPPIVVPGADEARLTPQLTPPATPLRAVWVTAWH